MGADSRPRLPGLASLDARSAHRPLFVRCMFAACSLLVRCLFAGGPLISRSYPAHIPLISRSYPAHIPLLSRCNPADVPVVGRSWAAPERGTSAPGAKVQRGFYGSSSGGDYPDGRSAGRNCRRESEGRGSSGNDTSKTLHHALVGWLRRRQLLTDLAFWSSPLRSGGCSQGRWNSSR